MPEPRSSSRLIPWKVADWPSAAPIVLPRFARSSLELEKEGEPEATCESRCPSTVLLKSMSSGGTRAEDGIRDTCDGREDPYCDVEECGSR